MEFRPTFSYMIAMGIRPEIGSVVKTLLGSYAVVDHYAGNKGYLVCINFESNHKLHILNCPSCKSSPECKFFNSNDRVDTS